MLWDNFLLVRLRKWVKLYICSDEILVFVFDYLVDNLVCDGVEF